MKFNYGGWETYQVTTFMMSQIKIMWERERCRDQ